MKVPQCEYGGDRCVHSNGHGQIRGNINSRLGDHAIGVTRDVSRLTDCRSDWLRVLLLFVGVGGER